MAIVTVSDLSIGFRGPDLLDKISCQIDERQRIGLLGRNGSGKTTFMRILCGDQSPDHGKVSLAPGKKLALLQQEVPRDISGSIFEIVMQGWQTDQIKNVNDPDDQELVHMQIEYAKT